MERIKSLNLYQKCILLLLAVMLVVFTPIYFIVSSREGYEYKDTMLYRLPQMEQNPYNLIAFQQEAYTEAAKLTVTPAPDSILRVFMTWKPRTEPVDIPAQELPTFERHGFTVVEWGGAEVQ